MNIEHHGAMHGVTSFRHQLTLGGDRALLFDCELSQGAELGLDGADANRLRVRFPNEPIQAFIVTRLHIDHVRRLPYLLAAGYRRPMLSSPASAELLPPVLEDALAVSFTRNRT
jgi:metallo-beta-lactamase family protein